MQMAVKKVYEAGNLAVDFLVSWDSQYEILMRRRMKKVLLQGLMMRRRRGKTQRSKK